MNDDWKKNIHLHMSYSVCAEYIMHYRKIPLCARHSSTCVYYTTSVYRTREPVPAVLGGRLKGDQQEAKILLSMAYRTVDVVGGVAVYDWWGLRRVARTRASSPAC